MKSFRQFLREMPLAIEPEDGDEEEMKGDHRPKPKPGRRTVETDHGVASDGEHRIVSHTLYGHTHPNAYYATHPDHGGMAVHGSTRGTDGEQRFVVHHVSRDAESGLGGANFYKDILKTGKHKYIQSDREMTRGGQSIWRNLVHNHPDVEVTRYNVDSLTDEERPVAKGKHWHANFDGGNTVFRAKLKDK